MTDESNEVKQKERDPADNPDQGKRWQFRRTVIVMSLVFCATVMEF